MSAEYNIVVVGGGIIGLSTALALVERTPELSIALVDKEPVVAAHQTGNNSGIIHSGLDYRPGSRKARLCVRGADRMIAFCQRHDIPFTRDGKLVVAKDSSEIERLDTLFERGVANGVHGLTRLGRTELRDIEPFANGVAALHVPTTGSVDFGHVARKIAALLTDRGVDIVQSFEVDTITLTPTGVSISAGTSTISARGLVNCAGLHADRVARLAGVDPPIQIIPFRGEYFELTGESAGLVR